MRSGAGRSRTIDEVRTLPAGLRAELEAAFRFDTVADTEWKEADGGLTEKALHRLADGALIESVLMHYPARPGSRERHTLCISSQAGCAVGCPFCATGELGFGRDLEVAEIVDQVRLASRRLVGDGKRLTNIVFMGMGEPLLNLDRVLAAIEALNDRRRFGLGARHITVSTSGVVPGIRRLTGARAAVHAGRLAPRRARPAARRPRPAQPALAGRRGRRGRPRPRRTTGRRISYEVTMIGGVNDTAEDATAMADLLRGDHAHVNLIPMNPVAHTPWTASPMPVIERLRRDPARGRHRDDDPAQPRPGGRRGVRPARGGAGRGAARTGRRPPARPARRGERGRAPR